MPLISDLFQRLPSVKDVHMSSAGLALWICWEGDLDTAVPQTLQDYGGLSVVSDRDQSLWFFFRSEDHTSELQSPERISYSVLWV